LLSIQFFIALPTITVFSVQRVEPGSWPELLPYPSCRGGRKCIKYIVSISRAAFHPIYFADESHCFFRAMWFTGHIIATSADSGCFIRSKTGYCLSQLILPVSPSFSLSMRIKYSPGGQAAAGSGKVSSAVPDGQRC